MRTKKQKKKELSDEQLEIVEGLFRPHHAGRDPLLHRPLHLRKLLQVLLGGDGVSAKYGRNGYTCSPCGQERCNAPYLQPPCYKHGAKEDRSAGNEEKPYDDHHK